MLQLRVVSPPTRTDEVVALLQQHIAAFNIVLLRGAALSPKGDLVLCDAAREGVNEIVETLRARTSTGRGRSPWTRSTSR